MKRASLALAAGRRAGLLVASGRWRSPWDRAAWAAAACGSGGTGMGNMPDQPEYDPAIEYQQGTADLQAGKYKDAIRDFEHVVDVDAARRQRLADAGHVQVRRAATRRAPRRPTSGR